MGRLIAAGRLGLPLGRTKQRAGQRAGLPFLSTARAACRHADGRKILIKTGMRRGCGQSGWLRRTLRELRCWVQYHTYQARYSATAITVRMTTTRK